MKSFSNVSIEELIDKVEENKYILALKLMLQSVRIAAVRGQSLPIGNYYTNLIESAKHELLLYAEEQSFNEEKA